MKKAFNKMLTEYGTFGTVMIFVVAVLAIYSFSNYIGSKGSAGHESNNSMQQQYKKSSSSGSVKPSDPSGHNEHYSSVKGIGQGQKIQDPSELLPKDTNAQWAQLNPSGSKSFGDVNLLKAGSMIGIDTVGQSMKNANLQIRAEPPNPVMQNISPWGNSTIEPDPYRNGL
jgi:hypothetical protein